MLSECLVQQGYKGLGRGLGVRTTEDSFVNRAKALSSFITLDLITQNHPRYRAELTFCLWSACLSGSCAAETHADIWMVHTGLLACIKMERHTLA